jgi:diguanylate cyclase (GGDEF)-like protein
MRKIILQTLLPWSRRQPPEAGAAPLDARADQTRLSTEVLRQSARLLTDTQQARGSAEQQVQFFCQALVQASSHLRLAWVWFGDPAAELIVPGIVAGPASSLGRSVHIQRSLLTSRGPAYAALQGKRVEPFNVSEQSLYGPWREAAARHGVRSVVALPLVSPTDARRGVFVLYADVPDYFEAVGLPLFEAIAELISSVLTQAAHQQRLELAARTDGLTGLFNRDHGRQTIESLRSQPALLPLGLLLLDVDHFKRINDEHGHAAGDAVLRSCAERLRGSLRHLDGLARWGGEEFVVWLPHTALPHALAVAEKLRLVLATAAHPGSRARDGLAVTASIGVTEIRPSEELDAALARADRAMYLAKDGGRNRVETLDGAFAELADRAAGSPAAVDVGATSA